MVSGGAEILLFMAAQRSIGVLQHTGQGCQEPDLGKLESFWITFAGGWPTPSSARGGAGSQRVVSVTLSCHELMVYGTQAPGRAAAPG